MNLSHSKYLDIKERGNTSMHVSSKSKSKFEEGEILSKIQQEDSEHDKIFREIEAADKANKKSSIAQLKKTIASMDNKNHVVFQDAKDLPDNLESKRSHSVLPQRRPNSSFHL